MHEFTEFPYLPSGDPQQAVTALINACREIPAQGEQFRHFRTRMKQYRLWDQERMQGTFDFLAIPKDGQIKPSPLVREVGSQKTDNKARALLADRLWEVNPLLFKAVVELLRERVYPRDEIVKHLDSAAYRGKKPVRPQIEAWLHLALGLGLLKMVGVALDLGDRAEDYAERIGDLDPDEFLEDMAAEGGEGEGEGEGAAPAPAAATEPAATPDAPAAQPAAAAQAPAPAQAPAQSQEAGPDTLFDGSGLTSPLGRGHPVASGRFAGTEVFPDDVLDETAERIRAWWAEQSHERAGATATDFEFDAGTWMEGSEEALYRIAVAAALVFRLGRDRESVNRVYAALDSSGVLGDLYYGTAPDILPDDIDPKALMLASLIARRCAESPDLAASLEKQESASAAFEVLEKSLGRGLLEIELFWIMGALHDVGALRFPDLDHYTALPRRPVRDTLFRLGFLATPYAHDAHRLAPAAGAAHRATRDAGPPDEVLIGFALAAGCAYDCPNRRGCEYACRERAG